MPARDTKFSEDWLDLIDKNGTKIRDWCIKGRDKYTAYCVLCKKTVSINNGGKAQLLQHSNTSKHISLNSKTKDLSQSRLVSSSSGFQLSTKLKNCNENAANSSWTLTEAEKLCRTEILWIIHVVLNNYSFQSCEFVKELFSKMFSDSSIPQNIQLCPRKISYEISHGLGPYFLQQISDIFKNESPFFTLMYDETVNEQNLKQLDVFVRYWSNKSGGIEEKYIGSELLGHATAIDISSNITNILKVAEIPIKNLLMLGSDGPNVNKAVFQIIDKEVKSIRECGGLISVGTCNLHVIHNAFGKGIACKSFTNVTDFLENINFWFSKFPSRREDLENVMKELNAEFLKTLRFVSNRWLSLVKVCERAEELIPVLKVYFLEDLPSENSRLMKSDRYISIKKMLEDPLTPLYLSFIISVGSIFEEILLLLQKKTTLIHILYDELAQLLLKLMRRFVNDSALHKKYGEELIKIDVRKEAVPLKSMNVGNKTKKLLVHLSIEQKADFLADAKEFYITIANYLQEKLPLRNVLLKNLKILHPAVRKESSKSSLPSVRCIANLLPHVIAENAIDKLTDEWILYVNDEDICEDWGFDGSSWKAVDYYWNNVLALKNNELPKYKYLGNFVKAIMTFSHGQATVERGFSINKRILTADRTSLNLDTLRGIRLIKDAVNGKAAEALITQEMMKFYKDAYMKYKIQKDSERKEENKKTVSKEKDHVTTSKKDKIKELQNTIDSAQSMIDEGNERLKTGLKRKSMVEIEAAQALIDAGNKRLKSAQTDLAARD